METDKPPKLADESEPGQAEPIAPEVESARLLANQTRDRLEAAGFDEETIRQHADAFIALNVGGGEEDFIRWAQSRGPAGI